MSAGNTNQTNLVAVGDVNGDGIADLAMGSGNTKEENLSHSGAVWTYFGHKNTPQNPWPTSAYTLNGL